MVDRETAVAGGVSVLPPKPLLRGWFHAVAACVAVLLTVAFVAKSWGDTARMISLLIFGLSMVELYGVSGTYHIGHWHEPVRSRLRALDHANIFLLIAGTYTPICFNVLSGWVRIALLTVVWALTFAGIAIALCTLHTPRWVHVTLYIAVGWVAIPALPAFYAALSWLPVSLLVFGGILYSVGAVVYARKWPNPSPRVFGFHEIFHLFVIAGSVAFTAVVWFWALPYPRV